jgi:hypothetical protein
VLATNGFLEVADAEAGRVTEVARKQREESAAAIREVSGRVVKAIDDFEQTLGAARCCADPQTRRWRVALRTGTAARVNIGELLTALAALGDWFEAQALPSEEPEEPRTYWGASAGRMTSRGPGQVGV